MTVSLIIDSCLKAVKENKTTSGFEVALAPFVNDCLLEDSFYELPVSIIANILDLMEETIAVEEASRLVDKLYKKQGPAAVQILPFLYCGRLDTEDGLTILQPLQNIPVFQPFFENLLENTVLAGKQMKKDQRLKDLEEENRKLKEENQKLKNELEFLMKGTLAKKKQGEIKKLQKQIDNLKKMLRIGQEFALAHVPEELNIIDAVKLGNTEAVRSLIVLDPANIDAIDAEYESTPLHWAAGWGKDDIIELLIDMGSDINARNKGVPFFNNFNNS